MKEKLLQNKYKILLCLIFIIGILVRLVCIDILPKGLNQDEASAGYEAFSILNEGVDRHNKSFPVQFIAWGSGQNVLYSYIMTIFIAIFGNSVFAIRLPMAIVGCISLFVFYQLLKRNINKKVALIGLFFFAICPWHIMKSRWGLESNLFPDLILWSVFLIVEALRSKKMLFWYIGFIILALSGYAYRYIIFLFTSICNTIINSIINKKTYIIKTGNYFFSNSICYRFTTNLICYYKYI